MTARERALPRARALLAAMNEPSEPEDAQHQELELLQLLVVEGGLAKLLAVAEAAEQLAENMADSGTPDEAIADTLRSALHALEEAGS